MDKNTIDLIKTAVNNFQPTKEDAKVIFHTVQKQQDVYHKQVLASIPSQEDRQRVYNL